MPGKVSVEVKQSVAIVTFENAGRLNSTDDLIAAGLAKAIAEARQRTDVGALVLRGAGKEAFCAGVDLKYVEAAPERLPAFSVVHKQLHAFSKDMAEMPFPTIALMHGVCYGGGVHLAASTDFRFADTALKLAIPAIGKGLFYPVWALDRIMKLLGPSRTRRLFLEGVPIPPDMLVSWGFIDKLCSTDQLEEATMEFAARLAAQPRPVMRSYLGILRAIEKGDFAEAARIREEAQAAQLKA